MFRLLTRIPLRQQLQSQIRLNSSTSGPIYDNLLVSLRNDLKQNIRNKGNPLEKTVIRGVLSEMKNLEIENHGSIVDEFKIYDHLNKLVKQRKETAKEYLKPNQPERFKELAETELNESKIIENYLTKLPVASEAEIESKIKQIIEIVGSTEKKKIFSKIPWGKINIEWKASRGAVSDVVNKLLK